MKNAGNPTDTISQSIAFIQQRACVRPEHEVGARVALLLILQPPQDAGPPAARFFLLLLLAAGWMVVWIWTKRWISKNGIDSTEFSIQSSRSNLVDIPPDPSSKLHLSHRCAASAASCALCVVVKNRRPLVVGAAAAIVPSG